MRVLVTRPEPGASGTAERLRALGHLPVVAPVSRLRPIDATWPDAKIDAVVVSSANALRVLPATFLARLTPLPLFTVGTATAETARARALAASAGPGTAAGLAEAIAARIAPPARLLYLAGEPRKPALETMLSAAGFHLCVSLCYRMEAAEALDPAAAAALHAGAIDAVLHFSRESAQRFAALAQSAGCAAGARNSRHLCMSGDVAAGLDALRPSRVYIAPRPTEEGLISLLDKGD